MLYENFYKKRKEIKFFYAINYNYTVIEMLSESIN